MEGAILEAFDNFREGEGEARIGGAQVQSRLQDAHLAAWMGEIQEQRDLPSSFDTSRRQTLPQLGGRSTSTLEDAAAVVRPSSSSSSFTSSSSNFPQAAHAFYRDASTSTSSIKPNDDSKGLDGVNFIYSDQANRSLQSSNYDFNSNFELDGYLSDGYRTSTNNSTIPSVEHYDTFQPESQHQRLQSSNSSFYYPPSSSYSQPISTLPSSNDSHRLDSSSFRQTEHSDPHQNRLGLADRSQSFSFGASAELNSVQQFKPALQEDWREQADLNDSGTQQRQQERREFADGVETEVGPKRKSKRVQNAVS